MVATLESLEKDQQKTIALCRELNDLVRGAVDGSKQAAAQMEAAHAQFDAKFQAVETLRKDVDKIAEDLRSGLKAIYGRVSPSHGTYRGLFSSYEAAKAFGMCIFAHVMHNEKAIAYLREQGIEVKAMSAGSDTAGGFLVPEIMQPEVVRLLEMYGSFRANALVVPMSSDSIVWPRRTGGLTVYCPGEGAAITASDMAFDQIRLTAKEWYTLTVISAKLDETAVVAIAELIAQEITLAFATKEDQCGFRGDGTSTYFGVTGIWGHTSTTSYACPTGDNTFAESCKFSNLAGIIGSLESWALIDAAYFFHRTMFWKNVVGQVDASGNAIVHFTPRIGNEPGVVSIGGVQPTVLGFPVVTNSTLPAVSDDAVSTKAWAFGSLRQSWMMGQRGGVEIARSTEAYFTTNQIGIRGGESVDIVARNAAGVAVAVTAAS